MKEATGKLLEKASRAIVVAERLLEDEESDFAANRAYYAMFYIAEALLNERGVRFRKHQGVHAAFGKHFAKTGQLDAKYHQWVLSAFKKRIAGDYGMDVVITADQVKQMIEQAREFLEAARRYLEVAS